VKLGLNEYSDYAAPQNLGYLGQNFLYFGFVPVSMARSRSQQGLQVCILLFICFNGHIKCKPFWFTKGSPYSITERRVPELIPVLGSQPVGDASHKPGGRLPLLSARHAVTSATLKRAATNFAAW